MRTVIIMRGIPGCGKTHETAKLISDVGPGERTVVVSADHYFMNEESGEYEFDPTKLPYAHNDCMSRFLEALGKRIELVVVDNTNVHHWEYHNYVLAADLAGYNVVIHEIMPSTLKGLRHCAERNSHGVPAPAVARMAMEFEADKRAKKFEVEELSGLATTDYW